MILEQVGDEGPVAAVGLVSPPSNFGMVDTGVYRSGFPTPPASASSGASASDPSCTCARSRVEAIAEFLKAEGIRLFPIRN